MTALLACWNGSHYRRGQHNTQIPSRYQYCVTIFCRCFSLDAVVVVGVIILGEVSDTLREHYSVSTNYGSDWLLADAERETRYE